MTIMDFFNDGAEIQCPVCVRQWSEEKGDYTILKIIDSDVGADIDWAADYMDKTISYIYILPYDGINILVLEILPEEWRV